MRLTKPLLNAIEAALDAALAGDGFEGGDFEGMNRRHFERAREWVAREQRRRQVTLPRPSSRRTCP